MDNFNKPGNTITVTAPANVTSGVPFILGVLLCIPVTDALAGAEVACVIEGVVELKKNAAANIAAGAKVNWESGAGEVIVAAGGAGDLNSFGVAIKAIGAVAGNVLVKLTPGAGVAGA